MENRLLEASKLFAGFDLLEFPSTLLDGLHQPLNCSSNMWAHLFVHFNQDKLTYSRFRTTNQSV